MKEGRQVCEACGCRRWCSRHRYEGLSALVCDECARLIENCDLTPRKPPIGQGSAHVRMDEEGGYLSVARRILEEGG